MVISGFYSDRILADKSEQMSLDGARAEHADLDAALNVNELQSEAKSSKSLKTKKLAAQVLLQCIKIDHMQSIDMFDKLRSAWLAIAEHSEPDKIQTLDDYFYYRGRTGGIELVPDLLAHCQIQC